MRSRIGASAVVLASAVGISGFALVTPAGASTQSNVSCTLQSTSKGTLTVAYVVTATSTPNIPTSINGLGTGCDVGILIEPGATLNLSGETITGFTYYGILNEGGTANVSGTTISQIGDETAGVFAPTGNQYGTGIYMSAGSQGTITDNTIFDYQKGGIVVDGNPSATVCGSSSAKVTNNVVTGLGRFPMNAQNGIQFGFGATATALSGNIVTGNLYTEGASKGYVGSGVLLYEANVQPKQLGAISSGNELNRNEANLLYIAPTCTP